MPGKEHEWEAARRMKTLKQQLQEHNTIGEYSPIYLQMITEAVKEWLTQKRQELTNIPVKPDIQLTQTKATFNDLIISRIKEINELLEELNQ